MQHSFVSAQLGSLPPLCCVTVAYTKHTCEAQGPARHLQAIPVRMRMQVGNGTAVTTPVGSPTHCIPGCHSFCLGESSQPRPWAVPRTYCKSTCGRVHVQGKAFGTRRACDRSACRRSQAQGPLSRTIQIVWVVRTRDYHASCFRGGQQGESSTRMHSRVAHHGMRTWRTRVGGTRELVAHAS
eukprot:365707-Chlamydomonas_euryale.AAC.26